MMRRGREICHVDRCEIAACKEKRACQRASQSTHHPDTSNPGIDTNRAAFEAWANEMGLVLVLAGEGYLHSAGHAWIAWQASRSQALEDAARACTSEASPGNSAWGEGYQQGASNCADAIRAMKDKP